MQLDLFAPAPGSLDAFLARPCTWYEGVPNREGLRQYTVAIRSPFDPKEMTRKQRHARGSGFESWRTDMKKDPPEVWAARFVKLLRRHPHALTFNAMLLHLTGNEYTGDVGMGKPPEAGLWLAVERGLIWWRTEEPEAEPFGGPYWFAACPRLSENRRPRRNPRR